MYKYSNIGIHILFIFFICKNLSFLIDITIFNNYNYPIYGTFFKIFKFEQIYIKMLFI